MDPNYYQQPNVPQQPNNGTLPLVPGQTYQQAQGMQPVAGVSMQQQTQPGQWQQGYIGSPQAYQPQAGMWPGQATAVGQQSFQQMQTPQAQYGVQMQYGSQAPVQPWESQYVLPSTSLGYYDQPETGHKKILLWIVVGFVVLMLLVGLALMFSGNRKSPAPRTGTNTSTTQQSTSTNQPKQKTSTAVDLNDYSVVCDGGTISNSTDYTTGSSPHPIVLFEPSLTEGKFMESSIYFADASWEADYKVPSSAQLVGCMTRKSVGQSTKTCEFQNSDKQPISIKLYPVSYALVIYEAKTGKRLSSTEIWGPATSCPSVAAYNKNNPKLYGYPDKAQLTEAVRPYITK